MANELVFIDTNILAEQHFFIDSSNGYKNILLIDDAVGSGATFNEVAKKIKDQKIVYEKVIGLSLTGIFKGFDVVSEI
jgi:predicted amidophosphoribosyltransferase